MRPRPYPDTATNEMPIHSAAATYAVFTCCLCSTVTPAVALAQEGRAQEGPLYTSIRFCPQCEHGVCLAHMQSCGFCQACCVKYHGRGHDA